MTRSIDNRWKLGALLVGVGTIVALSVSIGAGAGTTAAAAAPKNTSPPTIKGAAQEGKKLVGQQGHLEWQPDRLQRLLAALRQGRWKLRQHQRRQRRSGYVLKGVDIGNTIRFRVQATNADGNTSASSVPTAVVTAATVPPPPVTNGRTQDRRKRSPSRASPRLRG